MYLEPSEPNKISRQKETSTEGMPAECCKVSELREIMDSTKPTEQTDEPCKISDTRKATMDYSEDQTIYEKINPIAEQININGEQVEEILCNGHSDGFDQFMIEPCEDSLAHHQHPDNCESASLNESFDECTQCLKLGESSEHSANHGLSSECCQHCEHCTEYLQTSEQCTSFESFEPFEPDLLTELFEQGKMSHFKPDLTKLSETVNLFEICSRESEYSEMSNQMESTDEFHVTTLAFDEYLNPSDFTDQQINNCEFVEPIAQQSFIVLDDLNTLLNVPFQCIEESVDPNISTCLSEACEYSIETQPAEEICHDVIEYDTPSLHPEVSDQNIEEKETIEDLGCYEHCEPYENNADQKDYTDVAFFDHSTAFCTEEDESFETCSDGSIPSAPCSDSGGSDKGAQEEYSDEQNQWESFEEDDQAESDKSNADKDESSPEAVVSEDFFDLFDRVEICGHSFVQRRPYTSCFEGGDVDFYLEQFKLETTKSHAKDAYWTNETTHKFEEVYEVLQPSSKERPHEDEASKIHDPHIERSNSSFAEEWSIESDTQENKDSCIVAFVTRNEPHNSEVLDKYTSEAINQEIAQGPYTEGDTTFADFKACEDQDYAPDNEAVVAQTYELCVSDELTHVNDVHQPSEEHVSESHAYKCQTDESSHTEDTCIVADPIADLEMDKQPVECVIQEIIEDLIRQITEDNVYEEQEVTESLDEEDYLNSCTEREPYWSCAENGEVYEPDIEEYYAYETKAWKPCITQEACEPKGKVRKSKNKDAEGEIKESDSGDTVLDKEESLIVDLNGESAGYTESFTPSINKIQTNDQNELQTHCSETKDWSEINISEKTDLGEAELSEVSVDIEPTEHGSKPEEQDGIEETHEFFKMVDENKASEQSEDSEVEESEEDSPESCGCEYCIPPEQVLCSLDNTGFNTGLVVNLT